MTLITFSLLVSCFIELLVHCLHLILQSKKNNMLVQYCMLVSELLIIMNASLTPCLRKPIIASSIMIPFG